MGLYINKNVAAGIGTSLKNNTSKLSSLSKYFVLDDSESDSNGYLKLLNDQAYTTDNVSSCSAWNDLNNGVKIIVKDVNTNLNDFTSTWGDTSVTPEQAGHKHILSIVIEKGDDGEAVIKKTLNPDAMSTGCLLKELVAGEDLDYFQAVRIGSDGKIYKFRADEPQYQEQCLGITVLPADIDDIVVVIMMGEMIIEHGDFEVGKEYFVDVDGNLTDTPPLASNTIVQSIGTALVNGVFVVKVKQSILNV